MRTLLLSLLLAGSLNAQQYSVLSEKYSPAAVVDPLLVSGGLSISLQNLEMPGPGSTGQRAELAALKSTLKDRYPTRYSSTSNQRGGSQQPVVGANFEGNLMGGSVPNDNDIAISDDGYVVSVINTNIYMYDINNDSLMYTNFLSNFSVSLGLTGSKIDTKVVYDPMNQRFIMVWLNGSSFNTSHIIVCFSTTTNPTDPWNLYKIKGNPLLNDTWSDYPVIGISQYDLFIGVNTFYNGSTNNSGFVEGTFWQVGLHNGYNGDTLLTAYYHNIQVPGAPHHTMFNITPIPLGAENLNQDMYLLSNKTLSAANDSLFILHIDRPLVMGTPQLSIQTRRSNRQYGIPPDGEQPNGHFFDTNDNRIYGGFQVGDQIQYIQCSRDTTTGLSAIYHGFIDDVDGNPTVRANLLVDATRFIGYPNIAWAGYQEGDAQAIIGFNYVSSTEPGGTGTVLFRDDSTYSNFVTLKQGNSYVNVISGTGERWGDYSGIQRRYNQPCTAWMAGTFGKAVNANGTWIAEVSSEISCSANPVAGISDESKSISGMNVFPNPGNERIQFDFTLEQTTIGSIRVLDMQGRIVCVLLEDRIKAGKNRLSFDTSQFPAGYYLISIAMSNGENKQIKFAVAR